MKKKLLKDSLTNRLLKYSAAAGAIIAISSNADAQVAYSGTQNLDFSAQGVLHPLDLDGDGTDDFNFGLPGASSVFNSYTSYNSAFISNPASNSWVGSSDPYALSSSYAISASASFAGSGGGWNLGSASSAGSNYSGNFPGQGDQFIGVKFDISGETHYGWIRINLASSCDALTIVDWAYEETPDVGILAGDEIGDDGPPTVVISSTVTQHLGAEFDITITFSEIVTGLLEGEIVVVNGTVNGSSLASTDGGLTYTATITPTGASDVTVSLPAGVAQDDEIDDNLASNDLVVANDAVPTVVLSTAATEPVTGEFDIAVTFSETTTGLEESEITVTNGTVKAGTLATTDAGITYAVTITPTAAGDITISLAAGVAQDGTANDNTAAVDLVVESEYGLGIDNISSVDGIKAYPNPTTGLMTLDLTKSELNVNSIAITDLSGRIIHNQNVANEIVKLDLSKYNKGMYILIMQTDANSITKKIVIK